MGLPGELWWQCTPGCPQHPDEDPFPSVLGEICLRPAPRSFGIASCPGSCAQGSSGQALGGHGCARALQGACTLAHSCHLQQQEWQRPRCGD